jgi:predicted MFS family arabinose efflux permease
MSERPETSLLNRSFVALCVAQTGFGYAYSSFFLLPKYMVLALGAGPTAIGAVTAVHGAAVVALLPVAGVAVDRWGRRRFLVAGAILMAAASFAFAGVREVGPLLYAIRAVQALGFSMAFAGGGAMSVDLAPAARVAQALGIFGLTFLSMNAIAPVCIEALATRMGWASAFASAGLGALACAGLACLLPDRPGRPSGETIAATLGDVARRPATRRALVVVALVGLALCTAFTFHQPFAIELGIEHTRTFFVAYATTAIVLRGVFGHLLDRWGPRAACLPALVLYVIVLFAAADLAHVGLAAIGVGLGLAHGAFYPAWTAVALEGADGAERGTVIGLLQSAFHVGFGVGALGLGVLAEEAGYPAVMLAGSACVAAALVLVLLPVRAESSAATAVGGGG